jgi:hypothetical protein
LVGFGVDSTIICAICVAITVCGANRVTSTVWFTPLLQAVNTSAKSRHESVFFENFSIADSFPVTSLFNDAI